MSQESIHAERLRYQELFHLAPDAYLVTSLAGIVHEANAAAARLLNLDARRLMTKPLGVFVPAEGRREFRARLAQAARDGRMDDWETMVRPRGGAALVPVSCSVTAVRGAGGETTALRWLVRDVSERRRAEESRAALLREEAARVETERRRAFLEAVVRHMPGGVVLAEAPDGRIVMHNGEAERILGHPLRPDTFLHDFGSFGMLLADGSAAPSEAYPIARALLHGDTVMDEEVPYRRGDGHTVSLRCSASPVRGPDGAIAAAVVSFTDATDELRTQRAERFLAEVGEVLAASLESRDILQVAQALARRAALAVENARLYEEARKAVAARDEVVAVVSHDLRNPLNAVLLAATVLSEFGDPERLDARDRKQIDVIRRSAEQMTSLTTDLLEVSALESGTVTVTPRACAPATLLSAADMFMPEAEENGGRPAHVGAGRPAAGVGGLRAGAAGDGQPGGQRRQVHAGRGRDRGGRVAGGGVRALLGARHGPGDRARAPAAALRPVLAGAAGRTRRRGAGAGHRARHRGSARRAGVGRERARRRQHLPLHAAHRARGLNRRGLTRRRGEPRRTADCVSSYKDVQESYPS